MNKIKNNKAGIIFAVLGIVFLYLDMQPAMEHMDHSGHAGHDMKESTTHGATLLGIGEMTWMWFTMAIVHFFLNDCHCPHCKNK